MSKFSIAGVVSLTDVISAPLERINKRMKAAFAPINRLTRARMDLSRSLGLNRLSRDLSRIRGQLGGIAGGLGISGAIAGAGGLGFGKAVIDESAAFEKYGKMLTAIEGSAEKAGASLAWVRDFATNTPLQLAEVMNAFVQMRTFGLDPTDGSLAALVDQTAKMGGGAEELSGIVLALGQAWTKQKLQGEEALQLLERGVPVWDLLSKKTGKSAAELQKLATKGLLGRDAIRVLIQEIGKSSTGAALDQMSSYNGLISNLGDMWSNFLVMVGDAGIFDEVKTALSGLLTELNAMKDSGALAEIAADISNGMVAGLHALRDIIREVDIRALIGDIQGGIASIVDFVDGIGGIETVAIGAGAIIAGPLIASLASLTATLTTLGIVLVANPIGLAVAGIAAGAFLIYDNWGGIVEWFEGKLAAVEAAFSEGLLPGILSVFAEFNPVSLVSDAIDGLASYLFGVDLKGGISAMIGSAMDWAGDLTSSGIDALKSAWGGYVDHLGKLWDGVSALFQFAWDNTIGNVISGITDGIRLAIGLMGDLTSALGASLPSASAATGGVQAATQATGAMVAFGGGAVRGGAEVGGAAAESLLGSATLIGDQIGVAVKRQIEAAKIQSAANGPARPRPGVGYSMAE